MNDSASLGDTIRDRRLALGYSLGQLATKVNKTASSIRAWERGDAVPSGEESEELAAALDLDAALLATLREPAQVWDSDEVEEIDVHDPWTDDEEPRSNEAGEPVAVAASPEAAAVEEPAVDELEPEELPESDLEEALPDSEAEASEETAVAPPESVPDGEEYGELFEAKTEAVPVVPATSVAIAQPQSDPVLSATSAQPVESRSDNPVVAAWDDLRALYYRIFDPRRRWIYRVRFVLILIAFFIMLRVLAWAAGNLFDAIGEVLDSVSFSPGETPDVEN